MRADSMQFEGQTDTGGAGTDAPVPTPPGTLDRTLGRLAMINDASVALLMRPDGNHRMVTTVAVTGADRFTARRLARAATLALLESPRGGAAGPIAIEHRGEPLLVQRLGSGDNMALVLARRAGEAGFGADDVATLTGMIGWVEDVVELWWQHQRGVARAEGLRTALSRSDVAAILLDGSARVVDMNKAAEGLLRRADGVTRRGLGIVATNVEDAAALRMAIYGVILNDAASVRGQGQGNLALRRSGGLRPLVASVVRPMAGPPVQMAAEDPAVLLLIADPETNRTSVADACALYGLTASEARLAEALCNGMTVAEAAVSLQLTRETARTYLRRIFAKTGVVRQAGLVQLLMNSRSGAAPRREPAKPAHEIPSRPRSRVRLRPAANA